MSPPPFSLAGNGIVDLGPDRPTVDQELCSLRRPGTWRRGLLHSGAVGRNGVMDAGRLLMREMRADCLTRARGTGPCAGRCPYGQSQQG
jgi:hypothetical protein